MWPSHTNLEMAELHGKSLPQALRGARMKIGLQRACFPGTPKASSGTGATRDSGRCMVLVWLTYNELDFVVDLLKMIIF